MKEMRLQDYLDRLSDKDRKGFFTTIEKDEQKLCKFPKKFDEDTLCAIADFMNDSFNIPADDLNITEFIVALYKGQKADFFYEDVWELFEDIQIFCLKTLIEQ